MPKFLTIGYGDDDGYQATAPNVREAAHKYEADLQQEGHMALEPVQVRNHDNAGVTIQAGPFMQSALPVAGFSIIEADTLDDALEMMSYVPCAVAHGVVEVWPLK